MAARLTDARVAYVEAEQLRQKDFLAYGEAIDRTVALLEDALSLSEKALRTWAELVVDPTDRGTLAGLNAYGHDYLRGLAWRVYLESQFYGFSVQ